MPNNVNTIEMRKQRGHLTVTSIGRTPRGTKYLKQSIQLKATSPSDPDFKDELAVAVNTIVNE